MCVNLYMSQNISEYALSTKRSGKQNKKKTFANKKAEQNKPLKIAFKKYPPIHTKRFL